MANQTFPVDLQASPVPASIRVTNLTEFMQLLATYIKATVSASVTFFLQGTTPPTTDAGVVFYSTTTGYFMRWRNIAGAYVVTGQNISVGDLLFNSTSGDEISRGYFVCDGRTIATIPGIFANQVSALTAYYGGAALPTVTAPATTIGTNYPKVFGSYPLS